MRRCALSKASFTNGGRIFRLSIRRSSILCIIGGNLSPALLILAGPLGFRATCYYYRKAYYRAFFFDPPACAVGEPSNRKYQGETKFPFILQNIHRYFFYLAVVFILFLWHDVVKAFIFDGHFGVGLGTLVLTMNVILLTLCTRSPATRSAISREASWTAFLVRRSAALATPPGGASVS